jgi:hypothetical protein
VEWIRLAQDREKWRALVNAEMNLRVSLNAGKLPSGYTTGAQLHIVSYITRVNARVLETAIIQVFQ